jgi:2',3'-cyclic-nucleotide 2'-phosphodiesterase (5'-nucleotidase family)
MNQNAYFAVVPGNHDFQWGLEAAEKQFFSKLEPTVLCANMLDKKTGYPLPNTKPHIIKEIDGVKVAFIGVTTTKIATREQPVNGEDLIALNEVGILEREIALSRGEGAEVFIALVHKGFTDMSEIKMLSRKLPELDLIVIGHDHAVERASYRTGEMPHRTYIVEAGCYAQNVGKVDIYVDPETKEVIASKMKTYPTKKYLVKNNGSTGDLSEPME